MIIDIEPDHKFGTWYAWNSRRPVFDSASYVFDTPGDNEIVAQNTLDIVLLEMDLRKKELLDLKSFTQNVETEVTMLLQSLQWDRKRLLEGTSTGICQYNANHRMPKDNLKAHESTCALRCLGYTETDVLLPDPLDEEAHNLVKFSNSQIQQIINDAANTDPQFKKGGVSHQPLSASRFQLVYTADERRALYDAVVAAVPSCHDLSDLALASSNEDDKQGNVVKSRVEILAELRNMKRRRTKYRVAAKTKNYSDVLRDVIKSQMETYTEAVSSTLPVKAEEKLQRQSGDSEFNKDHAKSNSSGNKDRKYDSDKFRDHRAERRQVSVTRGGTSDIHIDEIRHREVNFRKETSIKSKRHESHRDKDRNRDKDRTRDKELEKLNERYRSGNKHESRRSNESSHRHKIKSDEENAHRRESTDEGKNKSDKRRSYDYDDRYSESRYYKEDTFRREKIKAEPDDQNRESRSQNSYRRDKKRSGRSRSRDRNQDSRKRKYADEDYRKYGEQSEGKYKRYYEVKKENP